MTEIDRTIPRNIVVFGQIGSGKSSIINMLASSSVADVSDSADGCTPSNQPHDISHGGDVYRFWDTAGLNESKDGTVSSQAAAQNLLVLVKDFGINLIVYCIRPRLVDIVRVNYELFCKTICMEMVPVVLVVTGLEGRGDMDGWWQGNEEAFREKEMVFSGHACITSIKGRGGIYEAAYEESAKKVWKLVKDHSTRKPWHSTENGRRNIVVFGQIGSGKSSIINMLASSSVADVSDSAVGCTPSSQSYDILHGGDVYRFWDTAGLNESKDGTVASHNAVQNLLDLVKDRGVNLLIYCIRPQLMDLVRVNYDLFCKIICMEKVPVVFVVTGLEGRDDMDGWWRENKKTFKKMNLVVSGHACITSTKGKGDMYEEAYKESAEKVWELVKEHSTPHPWYMTACLFAQAQQKLEAYEKNYKAPSENGMRRFLRELLRTLFGII